MIKYCKFKNNKKGTKCSVCGYALEQNYRGGVPKIRCGANHESLVDRFVEFGKRASRFLKEYSKWKANGGEYRSDKEIDRIYNEICLKCPFFVKKEKYGSCQICGCNLKDSKDKDLNKIAMSSTRCPDDPPKWVEETLDTKKETTQINEPPRKKRGCGCRKKKR